jgi:hypothetical protein
MARPIKQGLDYFPLDVDLDEKVELIEAKHGIAGFGILIKLFQKIYKEGYFLEVTEESLLLFSKRISVNINDINAVINDCLRYQIMDERLFKEYKILTSVGIQKRYLTAVDRRKEIELIQEYILVNINGINANINWINTCSGTQSKVKESKVKESKVKESKEDEPPQKTIIDYQFIVDNYHTMCPKMNKVEVINDTRKGYMNARVGEFGIEKVISVIRMAGESDFLNGNNDKAWKADFEWIMRPTNFIKVMEGKYKNSKDGNARQDLKRYGEKTNEYWNC